MYRYAIFLVFAFLLQYSEELRFAAASSDPKIIADSFKVLEDDEMGVGMTTWTKFTDILDEEKDAVLQVVEGGFVFVDVAHVRIHCEAPYPVEWRTSENSLEDSENRFYLYSTQQYTQRNGSLIWGSPDKWTFTGVLQLLILSPFVSRKYTCQGLTSNSHRQVSTTGYISVYQTLYVAVAGVSLIAEAGKKFEINVYGKSVVDLPCRLTYLDSNIQVVLQKKEEKEDLSFSWNLMTLNNSVVYDSKVGFSLSVKDLPGIVGDYRCLVNGTETDEDETVHFKISNTPTTKTAVVDLSPRMELEGSAKVWWEESKQGQQSPSRDSNFICCSNSKEPPELHLFPCSNPGSCRDSSEILLKSKKDLLSMDPVGVGFPTPNCSDTVIIETIFIVHCKGEGINVLQTYHYTFKNASVPELTDHGSGYAYFGLNEVGLISASSPTIGNEERMIKMVYFKSKKAKIAGYYGEQSMSVQDPSGRSDDFMYTGTTVTFRCFYSPFVFAMGGYWLVKWKTGDSKMFPGEEDKTSGLEFYSVLLQQGTLSLTMELERELDSVACGCSVLNTSEWKFRETKVSVRVLEIVFCRSGGTEFQEEEEEIVWTLRNKNVTLECGLSGIPVSHKVTWRKDGKKILLEHSKLMRISDYVKHGTKSVLVVPEVSHEMHGEYSCETTNVAGTAVKVFNVYVEEESSPVAGIIFGATICLVILGGMSYAVWKYGLDNLKKIFAKKLC